MAMEPTLDTRANIGTLYCPLISVNSFPEKIAMHSKRILETFVDLTSVSM